MTNTWRGVLPIKSTSEDGFTGPAPVGCFSRSSPGLHDVVGNVCDWTDLRDKPGQHALKGESFLRPDIFCRWFRPGACQERD